MIYYFDIEEGDNRNGGTSFAVLATGTDGATNGARNFYSASATFTVDMVGHIIAIETSAGNWDYDMISAFVDANNVTLYSDEDQFDVWGVLSNRKFNVGGRWKTTQNEPLQDSASPWDIWTVPNYWEGEARYKATEPPDSLGSATWTNGSALVTFATPFCEPIHRLSTAWTAAANNSTVAAYTVNEKLDSAQSQITFNSNQANIALNTKSAYMTLGAPLDLSAWEAISFWMTRFNSGTLGDTRLCLCSDTLGDVIVADFTLPTVYTHGQLTAFPIVLDFGGPLPSSVQSVAIYTGLTTKPAASQQLFLTNLIAVKPPGDAGAFSVGHLVGKVHNKYWQASTAFSLDDKRKPTPPNRNGFRYKVTTAGTTGATEPTWPLEIGATVVDGTVTWTCDELEDTWWPIMGVESATSLTIYRNYESGLSSVATNDIHFESETCETFIRKPFELQGINSTTLRFVDTIATYKSVLSGGWNRTDMSTMDGESWYSAVSPTSSTKYALYPPSETITKNFGIVRAVKAIVAMTNDAFLQDIHANGNQYALMLGDLDGPNRARGLSLNSNNIAMGQALTSLGGPEARTPWYIDQFRCDNNRGSGPLLSSRMNRNWRVHRNSPNIRMPTYPMCQVLEIQNLESELSAYATSTNTHIKAETTRYAASIYLKNPVFASTFDDVRTTSNWPINPVIVENPNGVPGIRMIYDNWHGQAVDANSVFIEQETGANRHTLSGKAWKVNIGMQAIESPRSAITQEFKIALQGNVANTLSIWVRRDNAGLAMRWVLPAGFATGVTEDIEDVAAGTLGEYEQLSIVVTPTETCVGVAMLQMYWDNTVAWTNGVPLVGYFDDLGVA